MESGYPYNEHPPERLGCAGGAFLSTDLVPVYKRKWRSLRRSILYLGPRTLVIIDRGETADGVGKLTARFHAPRKEDIVLEKDAAAIVRGQKKLWIKTLSPDAVERRVEKRPLSLNEFKAENPITMRARGFLELGAVVQNGAAGFVNVLSTDQEIISGLAASDGSGYREVSIGGSRYILGAAEGQSHEADGVRTAALVFHKMLDGFLAARATCVEANGRPVFISDRRGSFVVSDDKGGRKISYAAPERARLQVFSPRRPKSVAIGQTRAQWEYRNSLVVLDLPAGEGMIEVRY